MEEKASCSCQDTQQKDCCSPQPLEMLPMYRPPDQGAAESDDAPCCGPPAGPPSGIHEKPGYTVCRFVEMFADSPVGPVPRVKTRMETSDHLGTLLVRMGIGRNNYKVAPGLYALGSPDADAPVLVTANYKLSFDHLRRCLEGMDVWLLVLDTRGINVWCAAGKGTFGTRELINRVRATRLDRVVGHRRLIVPQLAATGVVARQVRKECGFEVVWGPVRAADVPAFLAAGCVAEEKMRRVTFSMAERMVLIPVELALTRKPLLWALLAGFVLSGVGPHIFSFSAAWERGILIAMACLTGILAGCVAVPCLLPWIPGRAFALKGTLAGLALGCLGVLAVGRDPFVTGKSAAAMVVLATAVSSYLAMNFTGTTPFTSPTGVEKEMRRAIPLQLAAVLLATGLWIGAAF